MTKNILPRFLKHFLGVKHPPTWQDIIFLKVNKPIVFGSPSLEIYHQVELHLLDSAIILHFWVVRLSALHSHFDWFFSDEE